MYYGRSAAYASALAARDDAALVTALRRSIPAAEGREVATASLAAYMKATDAALTVASKTDLLAGRLPFAEVAAIAPTEVKDDQPAAAGKDR